MSSLHVSHLQDIYEEALIRIQEKNKKMNKIHENFLNRLKDSVQEFKIKLSQEIDYHLLRSAKHGCKRVRWCSRFNFSQKIGNVKVSTLVHGWKTNNTINSWDASTFKEIGMDGTPFQEIINDYKTRGIEIKNISNCCKGFGFWIEASF